MSQESWSDWLDFTKDQVDNASQKPGVFMTHAAMKILFIGGSQNISSGLSEKLSDSCVSKSTRFKYMVTKDFDKKAEELIEDYKKRHEGKLPKCME